MAYKIKNNGLEVKTKDGKNIMGQDFHVEIKELDTKSRTFWCTGSTENPDRSNDIVRVDGWDLKNYKKAPRGLWAHNYSALPIFKALKVKADKAKKSLDFQVEFDVYEFANLVFNQYQNGFLSDFSVGFIGKEVEYRDENNMWSGGMDFKKHELLELSAVPVPDNPEAQKLGLTGNDDFANLIKLGFSPKFEFDATKGIYWNPISKNLDAFIEPKHFPITNGIKAVQAKAVFQKDAKHEVVGYLFDSSIVNEKEVKEWLSANVKSVPKVKFYSIGSDSDKLTLDVEEKEMTSDDDTKGGFLASIEIEDDESKVNPKPEEDEDKSKTENCPECGKPLNADGECTNDECGKKGKKPSAEDIPEEENETAVCAGCGKPKKSTGEGDKGVICTCASEEEKRVLSDEIYQQLVEQEIIMFKLINLPVEISELNILSERRGFNDVEKEQIISKLKELKLWKEEETKELQKLTITLSGDNGFTSTKTFDGDKAKQLLQIFDKDLFASVEFISNLGKDVGELKEMLEELKGIIEVKTVKVIPDENSDENSEKTFELDFSGFPPVSSKSDDSEKTFELDSLEMIENLSTNTVIDDKIGKKFNQLFAEILNEDSIELD